MNSDQAMTTLLALPLADRARCAFGLINSIAGDPALPPGLKQPTYHLWYRIEEMTSRLSNPPTSASGPRPGAPTPVESPTSKLSPRRSAVARGHFKG